MPSVRWEAHMQPTCTSRRGRGDTTSLVTSRPVMEEGNGGIQKYQKELRSLRKINGEETIELL